MSLSVGKIFVYFLLYARRAGKFFDAFLQLCYNNIVTNCKRGRLFVKNSEETIRDINGTMTIEGMPLTEEDKVTLRKCITGKVSSDEMVKRLVKQLDRNNANRK